MNDDLDVIEGLLGLSHYRGSQITAEEMTRARQILTEYRATITRLEAERDEAKARSAKYREQWQRSENQRQAVEKVINEGKNNE